MKVLIKPQVVVNEEDSDVDEIEPEAIAMCDLGPCLPLQCTLGACNPLSGDTSDGDILF